MPFIVIIVGLILVSAGARNRTAQLGRLLASDFTGSSGFFYWLVAIWLIGSIGYVKKLESVSRAFMILILTVLVLSNRGVFVKFNEALASLSPSAPATQADVGVATQDQVEGATPETGESKPVLNAPDSLTGYKNLLDNFSFVPQFDPDKGFFNQPFIQLPPAIKDAYKFLNTPLNPGKPLDNLGMPVP